MTDLIKGFNVQGTEHKIEASFTSNTTNYLTKIPHNLNITLSSDGTLTLLAGSVVYIPNGFEQDGVTPVFTEITISEDITKTANLNTKTFAVYDSNLSSNQVRTRKQSESYSGSSPSFTSTDVYYYDTVNNRAGISSDGGSTFTWGVSLPLAALTEGSSKIESIDTIFNGFGWVGNCIFGYPGIEGRVANGFNVDGTLKSSSFEITKFVFEQRDGGWETFSRYFKLQNNYLSAAVSQNYFYDASKNLNYESGNLVDTLFVGNIVSSGGKIASITTPTCSLPNTSSASTTYSSGTGIAISNGVISNTGLINTATGTNSLTIGSTYPATVTAATNIGVDSQPSNYGIALGAASKAPPYGIAIGTIAQAGSSTIGSVLVGYYAKAASNCQQAVAIGYYAEQNSGSYGIAIGSHASSNANSAYMIGCARNSDANTLKVTFNRDPENQPTDESGGLYTLLDSSGKIPAVRLSNIYEVVQTLPASTTSGKIYFVTGS